MNSFFLATWRSGLRSRVGYGILVFGILFVGIAFLSAAFSPRQPKTIALDVGFSGVRFSLVVFALLWVQEIIFREIQQKSVVYALAYPVSRLDYLLGRFLGVMALLALAALILGLMLRTIIPFAGGSYIPSFPVDYGFKFWLVIFGLWMDSVLVASFALFVATLSTVSMLPVLLGLAFAIAGKGLGVVLDYFQKGADGDLSLLAAYGPVIDVIQWVLPDLSRLDWRIWAMYDLPVDIHAVVIAMMMGLGYVVICTSFSVILFNRREFS